MRRLTLEKILERALEISRDVVAPNAERIDREAVWPAEELRALQRADLGGLVVPEEYGGLGFGLLALTQVCEAIGQASASAALCFGMHCVGSAVIAAKPSEEQAERYLDPIVRGEHLTTLALSEPGTGSHFWIPTTTLSRVAAGWSVSGQKTFVTNGGHADSYVVSTVTADGDSTAGTFSTVLVPADADGLQWGPPWQGVGMRGNSSRSLELNDVVLPDHALLGREGDQSWYVFNVVAPYFLCAMAGSYLGVAAAALDATRVHLVERRYVHDGSRLAENSVLQHRFGTLWAELERTRRLAYHAAAEGDGGGANALPALAAAKAEVADAGVHLANEAMTLCGGIAYREGGLLDRCLRDVRAAHVMSPTTDLLRLWTGRAVLGENLLSD